MTSLRQVIENDVETLYFFTNFYIEDRDYEEVSATVFIV